MVGDTMKWEYMNDLEDNCDVIMSGDVVRATVVRITLMEYAVVRTNV